MMPARASAIVATRLGRVYKEGPSLVTAVADANLTVSRGSFVVLMGPSGSGKTTLLSMLGCILTPTNGNLEIMGVPVVWKEGWLSKFRRQQIGFIFQQFNLFTALTAAENVHMALRLKGDSADADRRARQALDLVGVAHRADFMPRDLSGGEKQRVAIARAIVGNPPLVLADEPTGNLDTANGRIVLELLKRAAVKENRAVVVVSHDPRVVEFADQVVVMQDGHLRYHSDVGSDRAAGRRLRPVHAASKS